MRRCTKRIICKLVQVCALIALPESLHFKLSTVLVFLLICYLHWCGLTVNLLLTALCHRLIYCTQLRTLRSILIYGYAALDETAYLQACAGLCVDCTAWVCTFNSLHPSLFVDMLLALCNFCTASREFAGISLDGFLRRCRKRIYSHKPLTTVR